MLRHLLVTAWRDLARSPVQSLIAIGGLAIGLMAAILAGIITANQYSYDHFIPGSGQVYYAGLEMRRWGETSGLGTVNSGTPLDLASLVVAILTVSGQTWLVARQKPVLALRYE